MKNSDHKKRSYRPRCPSRLVVFCTMTLSCASCCSQALQEIERVAVDSQIDDASIVRYTEARREVGGGGETYPFINDVHLDEPNTKVRGLALGAFHSCAILDSGAARCWGRNDHGQLGYGNTEDIGDDETPASAGDIDIGSDVVQIAAGCYHTCALLKSGKVRCFGLGLQGQLGYGNIEDIGDDETPASAGDVDVGGKAIQLAAGCYHTVALLEDGSIRAWGKLYFGNLKTRIRDFVGDNETPTHLGRIRLGRKVAQISAGGGQTCALLTNRAVKCWGEESMLLGESSCDGSCGERLFNHHDGTTTVSPDESGAINSIATGGCQTCLLRDNSPVECWGCPVFVGSKSDDPYSMTSFEILGNIVSVASGDGHSCSVSDTGRVQCWGRAKHGQLGYESTKTTKHGTTIGSLPEVKLNGQAKEVAVGREHTCALLVNGTVACWGRNSFGQLGYGHRRNIGDEAGEIPPRDVLIQ